MQEGFVEIMKVCQHWYKNNGQCSPCPRGNKTLLTCSVLKAADQAFSKKLTDKEIRRIKNKLKDGFRNETRRA